MGTARWPVVAALAGVLVASGCGGGGDDQSKTEAWADSVCQAFTSWQQSVEDSANQLQSGAPSRDTVTSAADSIREATRTLADDLSGLGKPQTQSGDQAQASLKTLSTQLSNSANDIQSAASAATDLSGAVTAASAIAASISKVGSEVRTTVQQLDDLDTKGELEQAFNDSKSCKDLRS
jgi:ABC-type transporter Mla subunit MlaD